MTLLELTGNQDDRMYQEIMKFWAEIVNGVPKDQQTPETLKGMIYDHEWIEGVTLDHVVYQMFKTMPKAKQEELLTRVIRAHSGEAK